MVGKGVLLECVDDPRITDILLINRNPVAITHPKVTEVIHRDFSEFSSIADRLKGYDACFHCMGVSSAGMSEEQYTVLTFGVTKALADVLYATNPQMVMNFVSGQGSDSSEQGNTMWARVKGRTENTILNTGFKDAYAFQPGVIVPERGIKSRTNWYQLFYTITRPLFPLFKRLKSVTTTTAIGKAMINSCFHPQESKRLEVAEINSLAERR